MSSPVKEEGQQPMWGNKGGRRDLGIDKFEELKYKGFGWGSYGAVTQK